MDVSPSPHYTGLNLIHYRSWLNSDRLSMTQFVLSHNPQVSSQSLLVLQATELAGGLSEQAMQGVSIDVLQHPHWKVRVTSDVSPEELAQTVLKAWRRFRIRQGGPTDFTILALGGRKDGLATPNSLLQVGSWGVDVVETDQPSEFLANINWEGLKSGRPADAILEIYNFPQ
jgi:hypothetical protein